MLPCLLLVWVFQEPALKFVRPVEATFAGRTTFKLAVSVDPDDIVGVELQVNGRYAAYFEEPPWETDIDMKGFPEGPVTVQAVLERFDGRKEIAVFDGTNIQPDVEEGVTLIRVPVLPETPSAAFQTMDFRLFEDDVEKKIEMVLGGEKPMYLVAVLDMSTSMEKRLLVLRRSMETLMTRVRPGDILHVIGFNHRVFEVSPPETDMDKVRERLALMEAQGDTNLYGALYSGLKILGRSNERRALLLFTDGDHTVLPADDLYEKTKEDCVETARTLGVPIYTVGFGVKVNRTMLEELSATTGGKAFFKTAPKHLAEAFDLIGEELHHQYLLCYYTRAGVGRHAIRVELRGAGPKLLYPTHMTFSSETF